jgi:hypothetical protein
MRCDAVRSEQNMEPVIAEPPKPFACPRVPIDIDASFLAESFYRAAGLVKMKMRRAQTPVLKCAEE